MLFGISQCFILSLSNLSILISLGYHCVLSSVFLLWPPSVDQDITVFYPQSFYSDLHQLISISQCFILSISTLTSISRSVYHSASSLVFVCWPPSVDMDITVFHPQTFYSDLLQKIRISHCFILSLSTLTSISRSVYHSASSLVFVCWPPSVDLDITVLHP